MILLTMNLLYPAQTVFPSTMTAMKFPTNVNFLKNRHSFKRVQQGQKLNLSMPFYYKMARLKLNHSVKSLNLPISKETRPVFQNQTVIPHPLSSGSVTYFHRMMRILIRTPSSTAPKINRTLKHTQLRRNRIRRSLK